MAHIPGPRLLAFAHIQKTAGMTLQLVLRQSFGFRHLDVSHRSGRIYTAADLAVDLRRLPFLRSVAGHGLMPFVDYGAANSRMSWVTFVREPIARFLSHYQHHVEQMGRSISLEDFLREPIQANRQVQFLAGAQDLDAAKEIVRKRLACVGVVERFHESLVLLRERSGCDGLRLVYGRPRNRARSRDCAERVQLEARRLRHVIRDRNALDLELYEWIVEKVFPRQVAEYGGAERLAADAATAFVPAERSFGDRVRAWQSATLRKAVYVPMLRAGATLRPAPAMT